MRQSESGISSASNRKDRAKEEEERDRLAVGLSGVHCWMSRGPNVDAVNLYLARRTEAAAASARVRERHVVHLKYLLYKNNLATLPPLPFDNVSLAAAYHKQTDVTESNQLSLMSIHL